MGPKSPRVRGAEKHARGGDLKKVQMFVSHINGKMLFWTINPMVFV